MPSSSVVELDRQSGGKPLAGSLTWSREPLGWIAEWRTVHGGEHHWRIAAVNFVAAFRNAFSGAGQILSGTGEPVWPPAMPGRCAD